MGHAFGLGHICDAKVANWGQPSNIMGSKWACPNACGGTFSGSFSGGNRLKGFAHDPYVECRCSKMVCGDETICQEYQNAGQPRIGQVQLILWYAEEFARNFGMKHSWSSSLPIRLACDSGTCSHYPNDPPPEVEVTMNLPAGWSMMSLPVKPEVRTVTTVFPEAVVVYKYQKGSGYVRVREGDKLEVGTGYWILLNNPQTYTIRGTTITEYTIPEAEDGWYMIGGCSMPAQKNCIDGRIAVIYSYTPGIGYERLLESESLESAKGYWVLLSNTSDGSEFIASSWCKISH